MSHPRFARASDADTPPTDGVAAIGIGVGDLAAFEQVFREQGAALRAFAYRIVRSRDIAADVVQEAFLVAWRARRPWDSEQALTSYLFMTARSQALMYLRHQRVQTRHAITVMQRDDPAAAPAADATAHEVARRAAVQRAIDALPERTRLVLLLSRYTDLTYAEIAATLGISVKRVGVHINRAFRQLHAQLSGYWPLALVACALVGRTQATGF